MSTTDQFVLDQLNDLYGLDELEGQKDTTYAVDKDWRIIYFNPAWVEFAAKNGAQPDFSSVWNIGADLAAALPEAVRDFYLSGYTDCLNDGERWDHDYECSSPENYRKFRQLAYPLPDKSGLLIVNSLVLETPHGADGKTGANPDGTRFMDEHGIVSQCCHCRRIKDQHQVGSWLWLPDLVAAPHDPTSHGLCESCLGHYYPPE